MKLLCSQRSCRTPAGVGWFCGSRWGAAAAAGARGRAVGAGGGDGAGAEVGGGRRRRALALRTVASTVLAAPGRALAAAGWPGGRWRRRCCGRCWCRCRCRFRGRRCRSKRRCRDRSNGAANCQHADCRTRWALWWALRGSAGRAAAGRCRRRRVGYRCWRACRCRCPGRAFRAGAAAAGAGSVLRARRLQRPPSVAPRVAGLGAPLPPVTPAAAVLQPPPPSRAILLPLPLRLLPGWWWSCTVRVVDGAALLVKDGLIETAIDFAAATAKAPSPPPAHQHKLICLLHHHQQHQRQHQRTCLAAQALPHPPTPLAPPLPRLPAPPPPPCPPPPHRPASSLPPSL